MKKVLFVLAVLAFSTALTFAQSHVQSGMYSINYETPGYTLDKNEGTRSFSLEVNFLNPFDVKPDVVLSVTHMDVDQETALRYKVETSGISRDGFTLKVTTWGNCRIFGISGNWMAHTE